MKRFTQRMIFVLAFQIILSAQTARATPDALIDALDLNRPDLAKVKEAVDRNDDDAARKAFADYLRTRTNVVWHFDPAHPPKELAFRQKELADETVKHRVTFLEAPWQFDGPIDWKFNPTTQPDSKWPKTYEWAWGLNRHIPWPALAKAYLATGDERYAREVSAEIADWCVKNPAPDKVPPYPNPTWRTIEAGIRMSTSWPETFFLLLRSPKAFHDDVMLAMVDMMRQHGEYLEKFFADGNWKTMESNGLAHVGILFPEFKEAAKWREQGIERQREELGIQVYPDGLQIELTSGYHNVSLNNFMWTYQLAMLNKIPVPADYKRGIEKMYDADMESMLPDRTMPNFNDSGRHDARSSLANALELFPERADWKWIVSGGQSGHPPEGTSHFFSYGGWSVMRSGWETDARCLVMDGGPYSFGHSHEDKLSFIMDAYGSHSVAEAGVFQYEVSKMRKYCLAPQGHNELSVDGLEQHREGKPEAMYMTTKPLEQEWTSTPKFDYVQASYGEGPDETWGSKLRGFVHMRRILFAKPDYWIVIDTVTPSDDQEHTYESWFHLDGVAADVDAAAKSVITTNKDRANIALIPLVADDLSVRVIQGQEEPYRGWIFDTSHTTRAVPTPYYTRKGKGPVHTLYVLAPIPMGKPSPIVKVERGDVKDALVSARIVFREEAVYGRGTDEVWLEADGTVHIRRNGDDPFLSGHGSK